jgi:hypothetical protein
LTARRCVALGVATVAASVLSLLVAPAADAMCVPGSVTLLPKPHVEPPRCYPHP